MSRASGRSRWTTRAASSGLLLALLAGIPWGLVTLVGWPLPREINLPSSPAELPQLAATPLTDQMVINLLAIAMWLVWGTFLLSFVGEVAAALRRTPSRRLPVLGPMQKLAAWLLSGLTAGVIAAAGFSTVTFLPQAPPAVAATVPAPDPAPYALVPVGFATTVGAQDAPAAVDRSPVLCAGEHVLMIGQQRYAYVVQRDDNLWRIAQLCLGEGADWPLIWELNQGRRFPQAGGTLNDPDLIYPGWELHLPESALPPPDARPVDPPRDPSDPASIPPAPPDPVPDPPAPPDPPGGAIENEAPPGGEEPADGGDRTADDQAGSVALLPVAFGTALIAATLGTAAAVKLRRRAASADRRLGRPGHRQRHRPVRVQRGRVEQQLHAAAVPLDVDRLEAALRHLAAALAGRRTTLPDIVGVHIDRGDIHLLLGSGCQPAQPPWQAEQTRWTLPAGGQVPHTQGGHLAAVPTLVTVGSLTHRTAQTAPPAATRPRTPGDDEHLLLDLERLGCLAISGDPDAALDQLRYLASELAMNSWSDDVEIILAGWPPDDARLLTALNPDRIRQPAGRVVDAVDELRQRVRHAAATLTGTGAADALAGRVHDLGGDSWMPTVLLAAEPSPAELAALGELATELATVGRSAVAAVVVGEVPAGEQRPDAVHAITVGADRTVEVPFLGARLAATGLPLAELERLARVIETARQGREAPVPQAPEPEPWARGTDAAGNLLPGPDSSPDPGPVPDPGRMPHPDPMADLDTTADRGPDPVCRPDAGAGSDTELDADLAAWRQPLPDRPCIRILGPVTNAHDVIDAPGQPPKPGRLLLLAEVLVYLAQCGRRGVSPQRLDADLWPSQDVKVTYRRATMSRARQWAGRRGDGSPWLAEVHYRLEDGYLLDWHLFRRLRARGQARGPAGVDDLRTAMELVRGVPLEGYERIAATTRSPYNWLPTSDIDPDHLIAAIVDTAHELAQLYLERGDTAGARWAVERAWLADPDRNYDAPWLDLLRAQAVDGHEAELAATVREVMRARDAEVEEDLDPAIYTVLQEVLPASFWDRTRLAVR